MKKHLLAVTLQSVAFFTFAQGSLPLFDYIGEEQKPWFSNTITTGNQSFDSWTISTGYHYPVLKNVNIYLATEISTETDVTGTSKGLLSGVQYNFNDAISIGSSVQAERVDEETVGIVGMNSKLKLTDKLNLEAKFDYSVREAEPPAAFYQFGVGYRF